jgi:hypothetical protein
MTKSPQTPEKDFLKWTFLFSIFFNKIHYYSDLSYNAIAEQSYSIQSIQLYSEAPNTSQNAWGPACLYALLLTTPNPGYRCSSGCL